MSKIKRSFSGNVSIDLDNKDNIPEEDIDILKFAFDAYSFLVPLNKQITWIEFSNLIEECYSMDNLNNKCIVEKLRKYD